MRDFGCYMNKGCYMQSQLGHMRVGKGQICLAFMLGSSPTTGDCSQYEYWRHRHHPALEGPSAPPASPKGDQEALDPCIKLNLILHSSSAPYTPICASNGPSVCGSFCGVMASGCRAQRNCVKLGLVYLINTPRCDCQLLTV
jgi:hypothetical protein